MTDFYNRYRSLFALGNYQPPPRGDFPHKRELFMPQRKQKITASMTGRSPALDQFRREVLPKLNARYPEPRFTRLATQMVDSTHKMQESMDRQQNPEKEFYHLPDEVRESREPVKAFRHSRVITEPSKVVKPSRLDKKRSRMREEIHKSRVIGDFSKHMGELEKMYLRGETPPVKPMATPKQTFHSRQKSVQVSQGVQTDPITRKKPVIYLDNPYRVQGQNTVSKKWQIKVLPKKFRSVHFSKSNPEVEAHESALFGLKDNPYEFVNSRLNDIKKIQKFMPRGELNRYNECLLRRKEVKELLPQRQNRLKRLLQEESMMLDDE